MAATYTVEALEAAHIGIRDLIDAGSSNGVVEIYDDNDVLLATVPLSDPCGTVSSVDGKLTFSFSGPDPSAAQTGIPSYGWFVNSNAVQVLRLDTAQDSAEVEGFLTLPVLSIIQGSAVEILSGSIL